MGFRVLLVFGAVLAVAALPGYGNELTFTLNPAVYPPGVDPVTCQDTGTSPCVHLSGTLTDTDTDGSLLSLNGISIIFTGSDGNYFTLDQNVFSNDVPGTLEGDTDNNPAPNTYTGPIFGVDIAPSTPLGSYTETAEITACNLTNDVNCDSGNPDPGLFTVDAQFTIVVAPEPAAGSLLLGGLAALSVWCGVKRKWRTSEARSH
jgi:hypothetical protein